MADQSEGARIEDTAKQTAREDRGPSRLTLLRAALLGIVAAITALATLSDNIPKLYRSLRSGLAEFGLIAAAPVEPSKGSAAYRDRIKPTIDRFGLIDSCDKLWIERNLIFNRYGFCFTSPLAVAIFDNGDCKPGTPALTIADERRSKEIFRWETVDGCYVDVSRTSMTIDGDVFGEGGHVFLMSEYIVRLSTNAKICSGKSCVPQGLIVLHRANDNDGYRECRPISPPPAGSPAPISF